MSSDIAGRDSTVCMCEENPINIDVEALAHRYRCLLLASQKKKASAVGNNMSAVDELAETAWADVLNAMDKYSKLLNVTDADFENGGNVMVAGSEDQEGDLVKVQPARRRMAACTAVAKPEAATKPHAISKPHATVKPEVKKDPSLPDKPQMSIAKVGVKRKRKEACSKTTHVLPQQNFEEVNNIAAIDQTPLGQDQNLAEQQRVSATWKQRKNLPAEHHAVVGQSQPTKQAFGVNHLQQQSGDVRLTEPTSQVVSSWTKSEYVEQLGSIGTKHEEAASFENSQAIVPSKLEIVDPSQTQKEVVNVRSNGVQHPLDMKYVATLLRSALPCSTLQYSPLRVKRPVTDWMGWQVALKRFLRSQTTISFSMIRPCRSLSDLQVVYLSHPECHPP